jgi:PKD repeat protein
MRSALLIVVTALGSIVVGACTVHQAAVPTISGPSGFALSLEITATPDHVRQDGESQSAVVVSARDANGQPIAAMAVRLNMSVGGATQDLGTLSARNAVTGKDGRATVMYAAPAGVAGAGGSGTTVDIVATSIGSDAVTAQSQSVAIILVPSGVILPPAGMPIAAFVAPSPVSVGVAAQFDASSSRPGPGSSRINSYSWSFGDGSPGASAAVVNHAFTSAGSFSVSLIVTNDLGVAATTTQTVVIATTALPKADFVFSPDKPLPRSQIQFSAQTSVPAPGRTIKQYLWNWGDGESGTGVLEDHDYPVAGTYTVVLTVVDDLGQRGSTPKSVTVGGAAASVEYRISMPCQIDTSGETGNTTTGLYKDGVLVRTATAAGFPNVAAVNGVY